MLETIDRAVLLETRECGVERLQRAAIALAHADHAARALNRRIIAPAVPCA
ncbi:hypothetical protein [Burkholderia sp. 22313]|uniref:hypothetical protein n=1 Tax=Burkholderia sp. 22313 TaxID=3453908 RepID=UPI002CEC4D7E|nr:hypothetical protein [Burkholderia sp.]